MSEEISVPEDISAEDVDKLMTEIGFRLINEHLGKPLDSDDVDDAIAEKLPHATEDQRHEAADIFIDILAVSELLKQALSDDGRIDEDEVQELKAFIDDLADDTKSLIKSLLG
jgi:hypothetical protein